MVENGRGCQCGGTTRYALSAIPGEKCANGGGTSPSNQANPAGPNGGASGGDMRSACAAAGGFFLSNQCLCEEGRTVSDASVHTAGSCTAPSLSRVCSATRGQLVESGRGCKCGGTTRYQLSAVPNEVCTQSGTSPGTSPGAAAPSSPAPAQQFRGDYCVPRINQGICGVINCNGAQSTCRYTSTSRGSTNADCERRCTQWYPNMPRW